MFKSNLLREQINEGRAAIGMGPVRLNDLNKKILRTFGSSVEWASSVNPNGTTSRIALLDSGQAEALLKMYSLSEFSYGANEHGALCAVEQLLGVRLVRQYPVLGYKIDGYDIENKVAYEVDEPHHTQNKSADAKRQGFIEKELGCTFIRISV